MSLHRFTISDLAERSAEMRSAYRADGCLVIENFASGDACDALQARIDELIDEFDPSTVSTIFSTGDQSHAADQYFRGSGDKIRFFFEAGAFQNGDLVKDKHLALNKIGHAMHDLDQEFSRFSRDQRLANLARVIGIDDPGLVQSMVIFKQPRIGGEVGMHQDATFLHTEPVTVTGFWFALEDADAENGCLYAVPGAHRGPLIERFHYTGDALEMTALANQHWSDGDAIPLEAPKGTLVVLHGLLPHRSGPNHSDRSRHAYALHVVDRAAEWSPDNWLYRAPGMPVRGFDA